MERTGIRAALLAILVLNAARPLNANLSTVGAQETKSAVAVVRECKPGYDNPVVSKKSGGSKHKNRGEDPPIGSACIEIKEEGLVIQEYLQKALRDLRWNIGDEQVSGDLWSFSVYLNAEDVAAYTKPPDEPKMVWSGGKALVNVRTYELADGFSRVVVTARFNGYGQPEDQFAPKRESWPLPSKNILEARFTSAAKEHFQTAH